MQPKVIVLHNHDNNWTPEAQLETERDHRTALEALHKFGYETTDVKVYDSVTEALRPHRLAPRDWMVFNWCEGYADRPWDYDGVTAELDRLGYSYTGADTWSHRVSADKGRVQAVLRAGGVSIPCGRVLRPAADLDWAIFPAIVKPLNQHGSYGTDHQSVVRDRQQLRQRLEHVMEKYQVPAVVEEFIAGREFQVSVWGNRPGQPRRLSGDALPRLRAHRFAHAERSGLRSRRESQSRYQLRIAVGRCGKCGRIVLRRGYRPYHRIRGGTLASGAGYGGGKEEPST